MMIYDDFGFFFLSFEPTSTPRRCNVKNFLSWDLFSLNKFTDLATESIFPQLVAIFKLLYTRKTALFRTKIRYRPALTCIFSRIPSFLHYHLCEWPQTASLQNTKQMKRPKLVTYFWSWLLFLASIENLSRLL